MTPSRSLRRALVLTAATISVGAGIIVGAATADHASEGAPPPETAPALADPARGGGVSLLDSPASPSDRFVIPGRPLAPEAMTHLRSIADVDAARLADERDGVRVYLAPAREPGAICILVVGTADDTFAANCPPVGVALAGQAVLGVRGGPGAPSWTFVGIAPDAVQSVSDGERRVTTGRNAFVLTRRGAAARSLTFRLRDGRDRPVPAVDRVVSRVSDDDD